MKRFVSLLFGCCLLAANASGAPLTATIRVERSPEASDCPDEAALTRSVEQILQRTLSSPHASEQALEVEVRFDDTRAGYTAEVRSLGAKPGERHFLDHERRCTALAEAVSVAIALLLDKELAEQAASQPSPAPAAKPVPSEPKAPSPAAHEAALELRATFEAGIAAGLVSSSSALLSEQVGLRVRERWLFDAAFNAVLPQSADYGAGAVRTTLLFGSARACYVWGARFFVGPCASLGVGRLRGDGLGYLDTVSKNLLWTALGAGLVAEGPVWGRVFWGLSATLWLPTRRSSFSVENRGTAWESSELGGALNGRLGFRIW